MPTASNVGSRDVTWASPSPHLSFPFASFRVFRGPHSSGKAGRFALMDFADLASTPLQSPGSPTRRHAPFVMPYLRAIRGCNLFASYADAAPTGIASLTSSSRPVLTL